jgi:hypothetical protein
MQNAQGSDGIPGLDFLPLDQSDIVVTTLPTVYMNNRVQSGLLFAKIEFLRVSRDLPGSFFSVFENMYDPTIHDPDGRRVFNESDPFLKIDDRSNYGILYFLQHRDDDGSPTKSWYRVFPDLQDVSGKYFTRSSSYGKHMDVYYCNSAYGSHTQERWVWTTNASYRGCDEFAMSMPVRFGRANSPPEMPTNSPFPVAFDYACVAHPGECSDFDSDGVVSVCDDMTLQQATTIASELGLHYLPSVVHTTELIEQEEPLCVDWSRYSDLPDWSLGGEIWNSTVNDPLDLGAVSALQTTGNLTISMRVRVVANIEQSVFLYHQNFAGEGAIRLDENKVVSFFSGYGTIPTNETFQHGLPFYGTYKLQPGCVDWTGGAEHHLVVTRDMRARLVQWYVNGEPCGNAQELTSNQIESRGTSIYIGATVDSVLEVFEGNGVLVGHPGISIRDLGVYERVVRVETKDNVTTQEVSGLYRMPWGNGDRLVIMKLDNESTVWWNNCQPNPTHQEPLCVLGTFETGTLSHLSGDQIWGRQAPDGSMRLKPHDEAAEIVLTRVRTAQLEPCNFRKQVLAMWCDSECQRQGDIFRICGYSEDVVRCLALENGELRMALRKTTPQGDDAQLLRFHKLDSVNGYAQLVFDHVRMTCLYVREYYGTYHLAIDYTCKLWTSVRFLREGVLVDADQPGVYTRMVADTLHADPAFLVSLTFSSNFDSGDAMIRIPSTEHFRPRLTIGSPPEGLANQFRTGHTEHSKTRFTFSKHRTPFSNVTSLIPASGLLVGRNWRVVNQNESTPIVQNPLLSWEDVLPINTAKQVRIGDASMWSLMYDKSTCKRLCELEHTCVAITWDSENSTCAHATTSGLSRQFYAHIRTRPVRNHTLYELLTTSVLAPHVKLGTIDRHTNRPIRLFKTLVARPRAITKLVDYGEHGLAYEHCMPFDYLNNANLTGDRLKIQIVSNTLDEPQVLNVTQLGGTTVLDMSACTHTLAEKTVEFEDIVLPPACTSVLQENVVYRVSAVSSTNKQRFLYNFRLRVCPMESFNSTDIQIAGVHSSHVSGWSNALVGIPLGWQAVHCESSWSQVVGTDTYTQPRVFYGVTDTVRACQHFCMTTPPHMKCSGISYNSQNNTCVLWVNQTWYTTTTALYDPPQNKSGDVFKYCTSASILYSSAAPNPVTVVDFTNETSMDSEFTEWHSYHCTGPDGSCDTLVTITPTESGSGVIAWIGDDDDLPLYRGTLADPRFVKCFLELWNLASETVPVWKARTVHNKSFSIGTPIVTRWSIVPSEHSGVVVYLEPLQANMCHAEPHVIPILTHTPTTDQSDQSDHPEHLCHNACSNHTFSGEGIVTMEFEVSPYAWAMNEHCEVNFTDTIGSGCGATLHGGGWVRIRAWNETQNSSQFDYTNSTQQLDFTQYLVTSHGCGNVTIHNYTTLGSGFFFDAHEDVYIRDNSTFMNFTNASFVIRDGKTDPIMLHGRGPHTHQLEFKHQDSISVCGDVPFTVPRMNIRPRFHRLFDTHVYPPTTAVVASHTTMRYGVGMSTVHLLDELTYDLGY